VFIYIYPTEEHQASGSGQWLGMLSKTGTDEEPTVVLNEDFIEQLDDPPIEKFGYSESERMSVFRLLVDCERKGDEEAQQEYPDDPATSLKVGTELLLTEETNLMREMEPIDPWDAIAQMQRISAGVRVSVTEVSKDKRGTRWYGVKIMGDDGSVIANGWISSVALIGQFQQDFKERIQKQIGLAERLTQQYKQELGKEFGLTEKQLKEISVEGLEKYWPFYPPPKLISPNRMWTDNAGKHRQEAKYVSNDHEAVTLRHRDGRKVKVPLERLSESDRRWVEAQAKPDRLPQQDRK